MAGSDASAAEPCADRCLPSLCVSDTILTIARQPNCGGPFPTVSKYPRSQTRLCCCSFLLNWLVIWSVPQAISEFFALSPHNRAAPPVHTPRAQRSGGYWLPLHKRGGPGHPARNQRRKCRHELRAGVQERHGLQSRTDRGRRGRCPGCDQYRRPSGARPRVLEAFALCAAQ